MERVSFNLDWVDADGITGPELAATWASLTIRVGDSVITRVLDTRARTVRDFVYVPVYPLAEWLATNWWFLTHELENPLKRADPDFHRRHALGANREGYAFPDMEVVTTGARTRLAWKCGPVPWTRLESLSSGEAWVESSEFRESCIDLMDRVIRRLVSLGVDETLLQEEWAAIQAADNDEAIFCETAAGLGWDPYDMDDDRRAQLFLLKDELGDVLVEAVPALSANGLYDAEKHERIRDEWLAIPDAIAAAKSRSLVLKRLDRVGGEVSVNAELSDFGLHQDNGHLIKATVPLNPCEQGYDLARRVRDALELDEQPLPTMKSIANALGESPNSLSRVTQPVTAVHRAAMVDGVITRNGAGSPAFAFRQLGAEAKRFHFCRAIAEVLSSTSADALLTKAQSERQQRNRAFAAEFLAPSAVLRKRVSGPVVDGYEVDDLAAEFGVSSRVIEYQLPNHHIAKVVP